MSTIIEVLAWGDFDVQYTEAILVSPDKLDIETLKTEFCTEQGIDSFTGLEYSKLSSLTQSFIKFLKKRGFRDLSTTKVYFCD